MGGQPTVIDLDYSQFEATVGPFCAGFPQALTAKLFSISRFYAYSASSLVVDDLGEIGFVGVVAYGVLKMLKTLSDGRMQIVGLLLKCDLVGRPFEPVSHVTIEAATNATLCCFHRHAFEALLPANPELEHRMVLSLSHQLDAAQDWMLLLSRQTVTERVASFILMLEKRSFRPGAASPHHHVVEVPINRRDMAAYLGTTEESISRSVQHMVRGGVIKVHGGNQFEIVDDDGLRRMSGQV
jgi:CRP/FNR family transcriptional regulator